MTRHSKTPEQEARLLLEETCLGDVPVDVEAIAEALGIVIRYVEEPSPVSGVLVQDDNGSPIIGVNYNHHPNRRRFTIAHELGHYRLHRGKRNMFVDREVFRRDEVSSLAVDRLEIEANAFAASLLMPEDELLADAERAIRRLGPKPDAERLSKNLARQYSVSKQAMSFRLANLGIIQF